MNGPVTTAVSSMQPTEFHNVGTPRNSDKQPPAQPPADTAAQPLDPWAQSADAARARASQPTQAAPSAWTSSHPAAPPAPAAQPPFVDSVTQDDPTAPTGLPRGWNQHPAEPFTTPPPAQPMPAQGGGFVPPGANLTQECNTWGTQRLSIVKMNASANSTARQ